MQLSFDVFEFQGSIFLPKIVGTLSTPGEQRICVHLGKITIWQMKFRQMLKLKK